MGTPIGDSIELDAVAKLHAGLCAVKPARKLAISALPVIFLGVCSGGAGGDGLLRW
jgi:hypothetical protein